jgi:hypothetical protein
MPVYVGCTLLSHFKEAIIKRKNSVKGLANPSAVGRWVVHALPAMLNAHVLPQVTELTLTLPPQRELSHTHAAMPIYRLPRARPWVRYGTLDPSNAIDFHGDDGNNPIRNPGRDPHADPHANMLHQVIDKAIALHRAVPPHQLMSHGLKLPVTSSFYTFPYIWMHQPLRVDRILRRVSASTERYEGKTNSKGQLHGWGRYAQSLQPSPSRARCLHERMLCSKSSVI